MARELHRAGDPPDAGLRGRRRAACRPTRTRASTPATSGSRRRFTPGPAARARPMTLPGRCDPEIEAVLDTIPLLDLADIALAREERETAGRGRPAPRWTPSGRVLVEDRWVPGEAGDPDVRVRVHRPVGESTGAVLLWVHGGGHVLGAAEQDDPLLDGVVARTGCVALAVDWRRAPEHPYPAALRRLLRRPGGGGGRPAGRRCRPRPRRGRGRQLGRRRGSRPHPPRARPGRARPRRAAADLSRCSTTGSAPSPAARSPTAGSGTTRATGSAGRPTSGASAGDDVPAYAAPARATDLAGLPPAWIATTELDLFRDEDVDYAAATAARPGSRPNCTSIPGACTASTCSRRRPR